MELLRLVDHIVYRPVGYTRNVPPGCDRPYEMTIFADGRAIYQGHNCVKETGVREMRIPKATAEDWIYRLREANFLALPWRRATTMDAQHYELELITSDGTNKIEFAHAAGFSYPQAVGKVFLEMHEWIVPFLLYGCGPRVKFDC